MSGRDERKEPRMPRCAKCLGGRDIIVKYENGFGAGWIISDEDKEWLGVPIVLNTRFSPTHIPTLAYCLGCGIVGAEKLSDEAIEFFIKQTQIGNCITWEVFSERNRRERH